MLNTGKHAINTVRKTECCKKCNTITEHKRFLFSEVNKDIIIDFCEVCGFYIKI